MTPGHLLQLVGRRCTYGNTVKPLGRSSSFACLLLFIYLLKEAVANEVSAFCAHGRALERNYLSLRAAVHLKVEDILATISSHVMAIPRFAILKMALTRWCHSCSQTRQRNSPLWTLVQPWTTVRLLTFEVKAVQQAKTSSKRRSLLFYKIPESLTTNRDLGMTVLRGVFL